MGQQKSDGCGEDFVHREYVLIECSGNVLNYMAFIVVSATSLLSLIECQFRLSEQSAIVRHSGCQMPSSDCRAGHTIFAFSRERWVAHVHRAARCTAWSVARRRSAGLDLR